MADLHGIWCKIYVKILTSPDFLRLTAVQRGIILTMIPLCKRETDDGTLTFPSLRAAAGYFAVDHKTLRAFLVQEGNRLSKGLSGWFDCDIPGKGVKEPLWIVLLQYDEYQVRADSPRKVINKVIHISRSSGELARVNSPQNGEVGESTRANSPPLGNPPCGFPTLYYNSLESESIDIEKHRVEEIRKLFLQICSNLKTPPPVDKLSKPILDRIMTVDAEHSNDPEFWRNYWVRVRASQFLTGHRTDFKATFTWLFRPAVVSNLLNGEYDG